MARDHEAAIRRFFRAAWHAAALVALLAASPGAIAASSDDFSAQAKAIQALLDAGKSAEGETAARAALKHSDQTGGPGSADTANLSRLLGDAIFNQQRWSEAEPHFRRALEIREALPADELDIAQSASDLAITLKNLQRFDEAETLYRQAIELREKRLGANNVDVARSWFRLARMFDAKGEYARAAETLGRAIAIGDGAFAANDRTLILWRGEQAAQLHDAGDLVVAEAAYRNTISAAEANLAGDDLDLANFRQGLANLLRQTDRPREAEPLYRLALAAREEGLDAGDRRIATSLEGLGRTLETLDRPAEAAEAYRRALSVREESDGAESEAAATMLSRLGITLIGSDRPAEAEPFLRRLLVLREKSEQPAGAGVADAVRWLASAADRQGRSAEAEILRKRVLEISQRIDGPDDLVTSYDLLSLGLLYSGQQRFQEAEPLLARAVAIMEAAGDRKDTAVARTAYGFLQFSLGKKREAVASIERSLADMQSVAGDDLRSADLMLTLAQMHNGMGDQAQAERQLTPARAVYTRNAPGSRAMLRTTSLLGSIRLAQGRTDEALTLYLSVLAELERRYGKDSNETQPALADIGRAEFARGDYQAAAVAFERSVVIIDGIAALDQHTAFSNRTGNVEDESIARAAVYDFLIKSYDRLAERKPDHRLQLSEKAFRIAQRVIDSQAARALSQLATRQAAGSGELAALVRERQDLVDSWRAGDRRLTELRALSADVDAEHERALVAALAKADARIGRIDDRLEIEFPAFADLQGTATTGFADVQARLGDDQVLLFYADTNRLGETGFETYLWIVSRKGAPRWIKLDRSAGELAAAVGELRSLMGVSAETRGAQPLAAAAGADRTAKVLQAANALYKALIAPAAAAIEGKELLIVPSRKLASLPFHLLVAQLPAAASSDRYRDAAWLARSHAITVLPSVNALSSGSRETEADDQRQPYLAFANPLLLGRSGEDRSAFAVTGCEKLRPAPALVANSDPATPASLFRGAAADVAAVRSLMPLPETADETCAVAAALGADPATVHLGAKATEADVKTLSDKGELARTRILHFATHGVVSGELSGLAEPAIVLTPPDQASGRDDGLLTASEVSTLKLDADWVILSACNTAAGDGGGEALSGLARAFFYAGTRNLMVSHWPVNSSAAVSLATGAIDAIAADPTVDQAEALRRAMVAEIDKGGTHADPANWAPFILVGTAQ